MRAGPCTSRLLRKRKLLENRNPGSIRASNFIRQFLLGEARGGTSKSGTSSLITSINYDRIKENNLDADNTGISGWNNIYGYIFDCNLLIQEVEGTALQSENASTITYLLEHINTGAPFTLDKDQILVGTHGQYTPAIGAALYYVEKFIQSV